MDASEQTPLTERISVYVGMLGTLGDYPNHHDKVTQVFVNAMMDYVRELEENPGEYNMGRAISTIDTLFQAAVTESTSVKLSVFKENTDPVLMSHIKKRKI